MRAWKQRAHTIPGIGVPAVVVNGELPGCCAERGDEQTFGSLVWVFRSED